LPVSRLQSTGVEADSLKVTALLIDSASGFHVWAERYGHEVAELLA
jgi:TolB-like protein